jgi:HAE1 family hydrophobic/amphiphilic exporter-1
VHGNNVFLQFDQSIYRYCQIAGGREPLVELSIKRPVFITCLFVLIIIVGIVCMKTLSVDLFPNINFPIIVVQTSYFGAGPNEIESLISKPIEDELASISGLKTLSSVSQEGFSSVTAEFSLSMDIKYAEQQIRDRVAKVRNKLPEDALDPVIRRIDPADQPILSVAVESQLPPGELYDLVDQVVRPRLEQVNQVGLVQIVGGRKREIHVELDLEKMSEAEVSASMVRSNLGVAGKNTPVGKIDRGDTTSVIRTLGEFRTIDEIKEIPLNYANVSHPLKLGSVANIADTLEDEMTRTYVNGKPGLMVQIYRQSGANTIEVANAVIKKLDIINKQIAGKGSVKLVQDGSKPIKANVEDVNETILIGIFLTVGAFILMAIAGFTINIMTLLALSLAVGLLVDDAIVVRENIFRHIEMGKSPKQASLEGTKEVLLAVVATTMTVIAVFGPIGFLSGVVGQFFKEFGLTVCFAMLISLADAITMAPMMSAYFVGSSHKHQELGEKKKRRPWHWVGDKIGAMLKKFDRMQTWFEDRYVNVLVFTLKHPKTILFGALVVFVGSIMVTKYIPKTFLSPQDNGEFYVSLELTPDTSLDKMDRSVKEVDQMLRALPEVKQTLVTIGTSSGESNKSSIFVEMIPSKQRKMSTSEFKVVVREKLTPFAKMNPLIKDKDKVGGGGRPFSLNISGTNQEQLEKEAQFVFDKLKNHPALVDVDSSFRLGKSEVQIDIDPKKAAELGVLNAQVGNELRALVEGVTPAVFREHGREYDVRVRLQEEQRDIKKFMDVIRVPGMKGGMPYLKFFGTVKEEKGPTSITRQDRIRYIQISAEIKPKGPGMGAAIADVKKLLDKEHILPEGMTYKFVGQAENFQELIISIVAALGFGILFIYMVLASLYESFMTPLTIMLVLPLAACGAFYALFITQSSLDLYSMIGCIMLLGIATKNSIILVDYINQSVASGKTIYDAILISGKNRLRPILMTSFALIAGMLPVAIGLNEASKQRTSMGMALIGGLISSTLLTLVVVPAAYGYIERFRAFLIRKFSRFLA